MGNGDKYLTINEVIEKLKNFLENKINREELFNWARKLDDKFDEKKLQPENRQLKSIIENLLYIKDIDPNVLMEMYNHKNYKKKTVNHNEDIYLIGKKEINDYIKQLTQLKKSIENKKVK